ncbi:hypothetical protein QN277_010179 [Acacia crassicarpa]|uniref:Peptidase A1 domain-containing protein n=1 Tax=Acacia crassicarpa TaxID=499986 RepID=A0AAE1IPB8_9FABA|nr:hypothetical protein QN277_010179 [Acacia crassicarpa]
MLALPLFSILLFSLSTSINGLSIDLDLVHRDSPLSPSYNSSSSFTDLTRNVRLRSLTRSKRLILQTDILQPVIIQGQGITLGEYLVKIHIGSPPLETWAIADSGSDLIWVQCLPCHTCYPQNSPIFNPSTSSTYKIVSCHSKACAFFPKGYYGGCGNSKQCRYQYGYGAGTTSGDLGRDMFSFGGNDDKGSLLLFGCGRDNTGVFSSKSSGIVGLGAGPLSLVSQLGSEIGYIFSYCLVPYFSNYTGKLKLGKEAKISRSHRAVSSTPFITGGATNSNYLITLEGVTVGNKTVKTSPKREGNTIIDSGGTWFFMEPRFYTKVEALIKESIGVEEVKNASDLFKLCYSNKHDESIINKFPDLVVHFKGGADLHLKSDPNLLFPQDDLICLAIIPQEDDGSGILFDYGNVLQVNFQVEYDLEAKKISFAPATCSKLN